MDSTSKSAGIGNSVLLFHYTLIILYFMTGETMLTTHQKIVPGIFYN